MNMPTKLMTSFKRYCNYSPITNIFSFLPIFEILKIITETLGMPSVYYVCPLCKLLRTIQCGLHHHPARTTFEKLEEIITCTVLLLVMCVSVMDRPLGSRIQLWLIKCELLLGQGGKVGGHGDFAHVAVT